MYHAGLYPFQQTSILTEVTSGKKNRSLTRNMWASKFDKHRCKKGSAMYEQGDHDQLHNLSKSWHFIKSDRSAIHDLLPGHFEDYKERGQSTH